MARFPLSEAEILVLGQRVAAGLVNNPALYPSPPVAAATLQADIAAYEAAKNQVTELRAKTEAAVTGKNACLRTLTEDMKACLRYAETAVRFDDDKLKLLGWGGPATPAPTPALVPPGQCRSLEAPRQGEGWVFLDWKEPAEGGAVAAYKMQRRLRGDDAWTDVGTAVETEITLNNQERGKEWEYRVVAVNKAGDGAPSNTVMAVL